MKIKITAKIKNFDIEIEDNTEDLKTWRKSVIKELEYLNKDIIEKGLETPENSVKNDSRAQRIDTIPMSPEEEFKPATPAQLGLLKKLGITEIQGELSVDEASRLIKRLKEEQHWRPLE